MSGSNRYIAAGVQQAYLGFVDNTGFLTGNSTSAPANGSGVNMIRLTGIQTAQPGLIEGEDVNIEGDDGTLGMIEFGPGETPAFVISLGAFDLDTTAKLQSSLVETLGDIRLGVLQPNDAIFPDCCLIFNSKSKDKDTGSDGVKRWSGFIVPLAAIQPLGREEFAGRTAAANRYRVTTQIASKKPWGVTILDAVNGTSGAAMLEFTADNPLTMARYTGTGAGGQTTTLNPLPASQAKTIIWSNTALYVAGVDFTVNTTTGVVTFTTSPAAAAKVEVLYEIAP